MGPIFDTGDFFSRFWEEFTNLVLLSLTALLQPLMLPVTITALVVLASLLGTMFIPHEEDPLLEVDR